MFKKEKNLANFITLSRIFGVGLIFLLTPYSTNITAITVILIYTVIALTDILDGWVARKYNMVSDMGKILDPLADKILVLVFLPLLSMQALKAFPVFIILSREFAIMGLRVFAAKHNLIIAASKWGKIKTGITLPVCGILMARVPVTFEKAPLLLQPFDMLFRWVANWPNWMFETLIWIMVIATIFSFLDYLFKFMWMRQLQKNNNDTDKTKKYFFSFIPNAITIFNLGCGLTATHLAYNRHFDIAAGLILLGVILDALDGRIARALGVYSKLGEKLDSKADFVTFGVAPAVMIASYLFTAPIPFAHQTAILLGILFYISVHYRLKRFNQSGHSDYFDGYPSPGGASLIAIIVSSPFLNSPTSVILVTILASLLMISKLQYPHNRISNRKIGFKYIRKPTFLFWCLTITVFLGLPLPDTLYIPEILLGLNTIYLLSPFIPETKS